MSSQITIAEADALLAGLVLSTELADWTALGNPDKQVLLDRAQAMIDAGSWKGERWDEDQDYSFPRRDDDGNLIGVANDADPDSPLAPLTVREALSLLAFSFVHRTDIWERRASIASGLASQGAAGVSEAYVATGGASEVRRDLSCVPEVWARLARFWRVGGTII